MGEPATNIPKYGFKVKLDHVYPEDRSQNFTPSLMKTLELLPLIIRYLIFYIRCKLTGKSIIMDFVCKQRAKRIYGVPLGGIGCGSIGRGFRGEFCRFQLRPGIYEWNTVDANQFIITIKDAQGTTILQSLLSTFPKTTLKSWESHIDPQKCSYTGLYPRAWTVYDLSDYGVQLVCRQISPVLPHNYKDSSLPCAIFVWTIENICNEDRNVTIAFTFKNGTGTKKQDKASTCSSKSFSYLGAEGTILYHTINKMQCAYALSVRTDNPATVSKCLHFDPTSNGLVPWTQLKNNGRFDRAPDKHLGHIFGEMGVGIAQQVRVSSRSSAKVEMSLVWDMPTVTFLDKGKKYNRMYTRHFGSENAVMKIVEHAFKNYSGWEEAINKWQSPILNDSGLPDWYKGALFNQTYFVSDGGSFWADLSPSDVEHLPPNDPRRKGGKFFYLEGHEYKMCNTYDVHFYASYALKMNWPLLQHCIQYDMRDSIFQEITAERTMLYDGKRVERKILNSVPHDLGDPGEQPFTEINAYNVHDVSEWRDLNTKFVLQVFRDACLTRSGELDVQFLQDMYQACAAVMAKSMKFDIDGDGLIENSGMPDQTFDVWVMQGSSAYCGGLWLAALYAMTIICNKLEKHEEGDKYKLLLARASKAYTKKLWNATYFNFDCSKGEADSIMADQLCGQWYLTNCGHQYAIFPNYQVKSCLQTIYENNVLSFCDGNMGAVNGFKDGSYDATAVQSQEVWTGVTYALASTMIQEGMIDEAFKTAGGMYESMTEKFGLIFDIPEALYAEKYYRAVGYMRPLSIWSMQLAWEQRGLRGGRS